MYASFVRRLLRGLANPGPREQHILFGCYGYLYQRLGQPFLTKLFELIGLRIPLALQMMHTEACWQRERYAQIASASTLPAIHWSKAQDAQPDSMLASRFLVSPSILLMFWLCALVANIKLHRGNLARKPYLAKVSATRKRSFDDC